MAKKLREKNSDRVDADVSQDEIDVAVNVDLPGALSQEDTIDVEILPVMDDEFTCEKCFIVFHKSKLSTKNSKEKICEECA